MRPTKKAPTRQGQGRRFSTEVSYQNAPRLSTAAEIIFLALQSPDNLRRACYDRLDKVLRLYYGVGR